MLLSAHVPSGCVILLTHRVFLLIGRVHLVLVHLLAPLMAVMARPWTMSMGIPELMITCMGTVRTMKKMLTEKMLRAQMVKDFYVIWETEKYYEAAHSPHLPL